MKVIPILWLFAETCLATGRYVMYYDQYHTNLASLAPEISAGITHIILAFAPSKTFTTNPPGNYTVFEDVKTTKVRFGQGTKVMIAVGGWGDTEGFSIAAATEKSRALFAKNIAAMLNSTGADGVDIDWEYPGGNGADYMKRPNSNKTSEITMYPLLLEATRAAIGNKLMSIAVPGLERDMMAYTNEQSPSIWKTLDFVNLMTYDLMNRRDTTLKHHSDLKSSLVTVDKYISLGLPPKKMNLGLALYAKYFAADPAANCSAAQPLGCKTRVLEDEFGEDTGLSGAVTFEGSNYMSVADPKTLPISMDDTCGANVGPQGTRCPDESCCSQYGSCGNSSTYCSLSCQADFGSCNGATYGASFLRSQAPNASRTDMVAGSEYFYDREGDIFWTWDTPDLIRRKFDEIVAARGLGGVMAWSLAEDSYDWSRVKVMRDGMQRVFKHI